MYNYGLAKFLQDKKLKSKECINAFLKAENITTFTAKHHNRVNNYIENNWTKFASFCDNRIKKGTLNGEANKMHIHIGVAKEYQELFNLLTNQHNLILTISEMDDIIIEANKVANKN